MFYKLLISIFFLQSTFFGANEGHEGIDIELDKRAARVVDNKGCGKIYGKGAGALAMFGASTMHALAAWYAWQEIQTTEHTSVKKALLASIVGNSIAATGSAIGGCLSVCSGKAAATCMEVTYGLAFSLANIPTWVAIGIEDNTDGVQENLIKSACLSSLPVIPTIFGICCSAVVEDD